MALCDSTLSERPLERSCQALNMCRCLVSSLPPKREERYGNVYDHQNHWKGPRDPMEVVFKGIMVSTAEYHAVIK